MIYGHARRSSVPDIGLAWLARDFDQEFDAHFREDDGEGGREGGHSFLRNRFRTLIGCNRCARAAADWFER